MTDNGIHSFCPIHFSEAWPGLFLFFFSPLLPLISMLDSGRPGWHCPPVMEMPPTMCTLSALASPAGLPVLGDVACGAAVLAVSWQCQPAPSLEHHRGSVHENLSFLAAVPDVKPNFPSSSCIPVCPSSWRWWAPSPADAP